jgi:hypothetical protein
MNRFMDDQPLFQISFLPSYVPADLQISLWVTFDSTVGAMLERTYSSKITNATRGYTEGVKAKTD